MRGWATAVSRMVSASRRRAVGDEVDADGVGDAFELLAEPALSEPGFEKSGGLGALSGRYDDNHTLHPASARGAIAVGMAPTSARSFVRAAQRIR